MPAIPSYDETTLLLNASKGDETAFRQLFELHWDNVYGVALTFTKSIVVAEEMAQDVFVKVWLNKEQLSTVRKFTDYLFIIARNHIVSVLRKKIKEESFADHLFDYFAESCSLPDQPLLCRETENLVIQALGQLPPQQQLVYSLSRQQGLSQEEIAVKLAISKSTVKSHMNKALHFIRQYLYARNEVELSVILYSTMFSFL